jgi:hypothetical protein
LTSTELGVRGETAFAFEATTPVKGKGSRKRNKKDISMESPSSKKTNKGKNVRQVKRGQHQLNQENHNNRNRKTSSSSSLTTSTCFGESKYPQRVTSISSCSDVDLVDMSLQGFLQDHSTPSHHHNNVSHYGNSKKLLHHHPRYHLDHHHSHHDDQDSQDEEDDAVDDDEGYDDYFDPLTVRETASNSLFFDEILNTNSPFL